MFQWVCLLLICRAVSGFLLYANRLSTQQFQGFGNELLRPGWLLAKTDSSADNFAADWAGQGVAGGLPEVDLEFAKATAEYFFDFHTVKKGSDKDWDYPREWVVEVLESALAINKVLPTLIEVPLSPSPDSKVVICGDTHGQFFDVLTLFTRKVGGSWPTADNQFVFNGDFVDRGVYSFEVAFLLMVLKVADPASIHVLRGNHECTAMNRVGGFEKQVLAKYDQGVLDLFRQVFQALPVCAVVGRMPATGQGEGEGEGEGQFGNGLFVTHGGIGARSASMSLDEIRQLDRFREPFSSLSKQGGAKEDALAELLWSDPADTMPGERFSTNSPRGLGYGYSFGPEATMDFLASNNLELLVRSHQVADGARVEHNGLCITVFSAPNYCDVVGNKGSVLHVERETRTGLDRGSKLRVTALNFYAKRHPRMKESDAMKMPPDIWEIDEEGMA